jgi:hypothetical protein
MILDSFSSWSNVRFLKFYVYILAVIIKVISPKEAANHVLPLIGLCDDVSESLHFIITEAQSGVPHHNNNVHS